MRVTTARALRGVSAMASAATPAVKLGGGGAKASAAMMVNRKHALRRVHAIDALRYRTAKWRGSQWQCSLAAS